MPAKVRFPRSVTRAEAVLLPWRIGWPSLRPRAWPGRLAPTRHSLVIGFGILAFAVCGYMVARESALFAIERIEVQGGSPRVAGQVRQALASLAGRPLVGLDGSSVLGKVDALPTVVRSSYDRAFPHTLRITIVPERPVAVVRRGSGAWLVSIRGRVMERLPSVAEPRLPRIWLSARTPVDVGSGLAASGARLAARAAGLAGRFGARITTVTYTGEALVFHLRSGLQLLLGDGGSIRLKVAVAEHALGTVPSGSTFLDVSAPGRAVSGVGSLGFATPQGSGGG